MCIDSDLFGDVIVRQQDVIFWLDSVCNMQGRTASSRVNYSNGYDIANKIKQSKLSGGFEKLIAAREIARTYDDAPLKLFETIYKVDQFNDEKKDGCPSYFHVCSVESCAIFIKRMQREQGKKAYQKRKARDMVKRC